MVTTENNAGEPPNAGRHRARRAAFLLVALTALGVLGFMLSPALRDRLGIVDSGMWFMDSYAVLAGSDAAMAGLDPLRPNPLDPFYRPHVYSDWWFGLGKIGLRRDDNFLVGATWVAAFLVIGWLTLRPRNYSEALWYAVLFVSPPVLLGINRANNDLVVFALLGLGALALRQAAGWLAMIAAIALATGLKFYPIVAAWVVLTLRPIRRMWMVAAVAAAVLAAVLFNIWGSIARGRIEIPRMVYLFGAPVWMRDLGMNAERTALIIGLLVVAVGGTVAVLTRRTTGLTDSTRDESRRVLFTLGSALLVGCFVAGTSYGYRLIFALWLAPWLWDEVRDPAIGATRRTTARIASALLIWLLWSDGVFCLVVNVGYAPLPRVQIDRWLVDFQSWTQPLIWALSILLAGWLFDLFLTTAREFRQELVQNARKPR